MSLTSLSIDKDRILNMIDVDPRRVWNIYLYGSRVYNTAREDSDLDFKVIASTITKHTEYNDGEYNVHVWTPDVFRDDLFEHNISALECVFAPDFARIEEKVNYRQQFVPNKYKMQKSCLSESHSAWIRGKMKLMDGDIHRGQKSIFHAIRILVFGLQVIKYNAIVDFSEANGYYEAVMGLESVNWNDFKEEFLEKKRELEQTIRMA